MAVCRKIHASACPVSTDGGLAIFGTTHGELLCCSTKRWSTGSPIWKDSQSHKQNSIVTISLQCSSKMALSSDSAGNVFLHKSVDTASCTHMLLCRSPAVARCVQLNHSGTKAILGGDSVRIIDLVSNGSQVVQLPVPQPIICIAFPPSESFIAVGSANRSVVISAFPDDGLRRGMVREALDKEVKTADALDVKLCWFEDETSSVLFIPSTEGVRVYALNNQAFSQVATLQVATECVAVECVRQSKKRLNVVTVTVKGDVYLSKVVIGKWKVDTTSQIPVKGVVYWSLDSGGTAVWVNDSGEAFLSLKLLRCMRINPDSSQSLAAEVDENQAQLDDEELESEASETDESLDEVVRDLIKENPHYTTEKSHRRRKPAANASAKRDPDGLIDDEAEETDESDLSQSEGSAQSEPSMARTPNAPRSVSSHDVIQTLSAERHPFVGIGSTRLKNDQQYLAFNSIGVIVRMSGAVLVVFHDKARGVIRVHRKGQCITAALGVHSAAFIFVLQSTESNGTQRYELSVRSFAENTADWTLPLPEYDVPILVAQCKRFTVVVGSSYTRVFTTAGVEVHVLSMPRTIAITGLNTNQCPQYKKQNNCDPVAVVHEIAGALVLKILNIEDNGGEIEPSVELSLSRRDAAVAHLKWMGWSDDGFFYYMDTSQVLRMVSRGWGQSCIPVLDKNFTMPNIEALWPWSVSEDKLLCYVVPSAQDEPEPLTDIPPPYFAPLCIPIARGSGPDRSFVDRELHIRLKAKVDDTKARAEFYEPSIAEADARLDFYLLKAFETELKQGGSNLLRCVDLGTMFQLSATLEQAARLCHESGETFVRDRLMLLASARHKAKKRRLCPLPAPGTTVSERDRDRMLRQLLAKERLPANQERQRSAEPQRQACSTTDMEEPPPAVKSDIPDKKNAVLSPQSAPVAHTKVLALRPLGHASAEVPPTENVQPSVRTAINPFSRRASVQARHETAVTVGNQSSLDNLIKPEVTSVPLWSKEVKGSRPAPYSPPSERSKSVPQPQAPAGRSVNASVDPFMTPSQSESDAVASTITWSAIDTSPLRGLSSPDRRQPASSAAIDAAIRKRYRDDDGADDEPPTRLRINLGSL